LRRNEPLERALAALQRIERTAATRRAEDAGFRCTKASRLWAMQEIERWRVAEIGKVMKTIAGGAEALLTYAHESAAARLAEIEREGWERRRQAAAAEAERCRVARASAESLPPIDALTLLPRAGDVSAWLKTQTAALREARIVTEEHGAA
jgi:hypothetical protein